MNVKYNKIDLSDCPSCVNFNIRKAMRAVSQHYDKILAPSGLRGTQFTILTVVSRIKSLSVNELAEYLVMERTTLTRNLKPLQKEDLLKIVPDMRDRRSKRIEITVKGLKIQQTALPYWQKAQDQMIDFMGKRNTKQFITDLQFVATSHESI